ncbi:putative ribonuclease isoform X4 [Heterocephalus glaber]|uniref:Ribonuclease isoform X4 n=1 Tax=Heterocephalus glaber TaxID=10181 RepID=A0AAX6SUD9_HETGA|nr:putative ribonuclease isoform X4 [Heterocephalus glaber]
MMATAGGWLGRGLHLGRASLATPGSGQARARRPPRSPRRRPPPSPPPACRVGPGTREAGATLRYARQAENTQGEQTADRKRSGLTSGPPGPPRSSSAPRLPVCYALPAGFHLNSFKGLDVLPEMSLVIRNLQRAIPIRRVPLRRNVEIVRNILGVEKFDLGIICLDNKNIQHINGIYRKKNVPTDVLSFPFHEDLKAGEIPQPGFPDDYNLGDIFLGVEYIFQQCKENEDYCDILTKDPRQRPKMEGLAAYRPGASRSHTRGLRGQDTIGHQPRGQVSFVWMKPWHPTIGLPVRAAPSATLPPPMCMPVCAQQRPSGERLRCPLLTVQLPNLILGVRKPAPIPKTPPGLQPQYSGSWLQ